MTKVKKMPFGKIRAFWKSKTTRWFGTLVIVAIVCILAIYNRVGISISVAGHTFVLSPGAKGGPDSLIAIRQPGETAIDVPDCSNCRELLGKCKKLEEAARRRDKEVVEIKWLPPGLQGKTTEETALAITKFWEEWEQFRGTVWRRCCEIEKEIARKGMIDTTPAGRNKHSTEIFVCVQYCLSVADYYGDEIDGDQGRTCSAVRYFQKNKELEKVDGKIGRETWSVLLMSVMEKFATK